MPVFLVSFNGRRAPLIFEQHLNHYTITRLYYSNIPTLETRSYFTLNLIRFSKLGKDNVYASQISIYSFTKESKVVYAFGKISIYSLTREPEVVYNIYIHSFHNIS